MTLRSSFKDSSVFAKATTILATVFVLSFGLCGLALLLPSGVPHPKRDVALGVAISVGLISSALGFLILVIIAIINYLRRSITGKEPPP
jgi:uncharacterized membrane protein